MLDAALSDPRVRRFELLLGDQEGVVLGGDAVRGDGGEVQCDAVAQGDRDEGAPLGGDLKMEKVREELGGLPVVPGVDDRVVQLD